MALRNCLLWPVMWLRAAPITRLERPSLRATAIAWLSPGVPIRRWYVGDIVFVSKSTEALSTRSWLKA